MGKEDFKDLDNLNKMFTKRNLTVDNQKVEMRKILSSDLWKVSTQWILNIFQQSCTTIHNKFTESLCCLIFYQQDIQTEER